MSVKLLGLDINNYTFSEAVETAMKLMLNSSKVSQVVTINPEMFAEAKKNTFFIEIVENAEIVIPDGVGVKLALKIKGIDTERIPGIDFARELLQKCAESKLPVAIIGSKREVVDKAVNNLKNEISELNIVYFHDGYFNDDNEIYNALCKNAPKLVLVAMGSPRQELFIYNAKNKLPSCLMIGVGGSLDVWSGNVKRAPAIFQKLGLEWLYRTVSQPERFKRIFPALPLFLLKVLTYKEDNNEC